MHLESDLTIDSTEDPDKETNIILILLNYSAIETADSTTNFVIVSRLDMFNNLKPLELTDRNRPSIGVGCRQICQVGTGLKDRQQLIWPILVRSHYIED